MNDNKEISNQVIRENLEDNLNHLIDTFGKDSDLIIRSELSGPFSYALVYIDGMVNLKTAYQLMDEIAQKIAISNITHYVKPVRYDVLNSSAVTVGATVELLRMDKLIQSLCDGNLVILAEGLSSAITIDAIGWESRKISEPTSQTVLRGPQEGFTETFRTNITMIRRRIKHPDLKVEQLRLGTKTNTNIAIVYINEAVDPNVLEKVRQRLESMKLDSILESNYIQEWIQDAKYSLFPTVFDTERPDVVAGELLEGRVAIIVDGTPYVLLVPVVFSQFLVSAEDYYHRSDFGLIRFLRYIALLISVFTPSIYVALTTFHQEMLPTNLVYTIAAQREDVPFPAFIEALMMELTFELLREAGIRMPKAIGSAISIVGALVIGEAAVQAGLVSAAMVIVVSLTAITSFIMPSLEMGISVRIIRFITMLFAATFGFYGIIMVGIGIVLHLCHLQSFGMPYMTPFAPYKKGEQQDTILRMPWWYSFITKKKYIGNHSKRGQ